MTVHLTTHRRVYTGWAGRTGPTDWGTHVHGRHRSIQQPSRPSRHRRHGPPRPHPNPSWGAITAAVLRLALGFVYLWAFISQAFGITYTNKADPPPDAAGAPVTYQWTFGYDSSKGWISSGFEHSPTESYVDNNLHGPLAFIPQKLPTGVDDFMWMFALGGLGIALVLGIGANIAGWGGFAMNIVIWLSTWPPSTNPIIDAEHVTFALGLLLLMWLQASNYWGLGRWWRAHTPAILN